MDRLKRRADFRAAAGGKKVSARSFVVQARRRVKAGPIRVGFTVSRQVGNAVERNRVRRRLREMVRLAGDGLLYPGHDYVLIGRRTALAAPFGEMRQELDAAISRIHDPTARGGSGRAATGGAGEPSLPQSGPPSEQRLKSGHPSKA